MSGQITVNSVTLKRVMCQCFILTNQERHCFPIASRTARTKSSGLGLKIFSSVGATGTGIWGAPMRLTGPLRVPAFSGTMAAGSSLNPQKRLASCTTTSQPPARPCGLCQGDPSRICVFLIARVQGFSDNPVSARSARKAA